jgi:hypothetical protein
MLGLWWCGFGVDDEGREEPRWCAFVMEWESPGMCRGADVWVWKKRDDVGLGPRLDGPSSCGRGMALGVSVGVARVASLLAFGGA